MEGSAKRTKVDLGDFLEKARNEALKHACFRCSSITTAQDIERLQAALDHHGVLFLTEAVSEASLQEARNNLCESMWEMFQHDLPAGTAKPASLDEWNALRCSKNGFGNASFGYINKQFTAKKDTPQIALGEDRLFVALNSVWSRVNLALLDHADNVHTTAVLLGLTHVNGVVSCDSAKYASSPSPKPKSMTKQTLTVPHVDVYSGGVERCQAMVVDEEGCVKLGWVPMSHHEKVRVALGGGALLSEDGYVSIGEQYHDDLSRGWLAASRRTLVVWRSGVVHYEASSKPLLYMHAFSSARDTPNSARLRCVVGVHRPIGLTREELCKVAMLAEHGVVLDFYRDANKHCPRVFQNILNRKSTQYLVARVISQQERQHMQHAIEQAAKANEEQLTCSPLKKHLYGLSQPLESLPFSKEDLEMLK